MSLSREDRAAILRLARRFERDAASAIEHYEDPDFGRTNRGGGDAEDAILIPCALRVDGIAYADATDFDYNAAIAAFHHTGTWAHADLAERMSCLFVQQRWLYKWGGERGGRDDADWNAFRSLFLSVCDHDPPPEMDPYIFSDFLASWEGVIGTVGVDVKSIIRAIHQITEYRPWRDPDARDTSR